MSWHRHGRGGRRSYHHGNLREALIEAALDLIAEKGPAGFTFAEAARQAGVSPAAPYRHFRDRDALMADVARRGFERFEQQLAAAWDEGRPNLREAFERLGKAYLGFARTEPAYYSAMFESGLSISRASRAAGGGRPRVCRAAGGVRGDRRRHAGCQAAACHDDGAAHLVAVARHRQPVRARRRGPAAAADAA